MSLGRSPSRERQAAIPPSHDHLWGLDGRVGGCLFAGVIPDHPDDLFVITVTILVLRNARWPRGPRPSGTHRKGLRDLGHFVVVITW
jgi:hypothetical protein